MTELDLLHILQRCTYMKGQLKSLKERLSGMEYKITPSYESTGGGRCSGNKSKVEDFATRLTELKRDAEAYSKKLRIASVALACPDLTELERDMLQWIADGGKPATFAEERQIYSSRVYKIRDKALKKAVKHITRLKTG